MLRLKYFSTALYSLGKAKGYSLSIVLSLGITLGALVAMFNLNYQILAAPLPYPDADRLFIAKPKIYVDEHLKYSGIVPYAGLVEAYKTAEDFTEQKALIKFDRNIIRNLAARPMVELGYMTPEYLSILQAPMALGRYFTAAEGLYTDQAVAIISYQTWQDEFNQNPKILTETLQIGAVSFKVVGVLAPEFIEPQLNGIGAPTAVWLPWEFGKPKGDAGLLWQQFKSNQHIIGKLKPQQSTTAVEQAISQLITQRYVDASPAEYAKGLRIEFNLQNFKQAIVGDVKGSLLLLFVGALALLLLALVNITNLILARIANQQKNLAIQAALGAQKFHLFNGLLAEILILVAMSMAVALIVAHTGLALLKQFSAYQFPRLAELHLSVPSLVFSLCCSLLLAFIFALAVSRHINYRALSQLLQSGGKGTGVQIAAKVRGFLILTQVMFSLLLLIFSLYIFSQSLAHIYQPLGFSTNDVYQLSLNSGEQATYPISAREKAVTKEFSEKLAQSPKVISTSITNQGPIGSNQLIDFLSNSPEYQVTEQAISVFTDKNYFDLLGVELLKGRTFTTNEFNDGAAVMVVSEAYAHKLLHLIPQLHTESSTDESAPIEIEKDKKLSIDAVLNQRFYYRNGGEGRELQEVIGIVKDFNIPNYPYAEQMFLPAIANFNESEILVKVKPGQTLTKAELNSLLETIDGQYSLAAFSSMADLQRELLTRDRLAAYLTLVLALLTLGLAAIGIYGVLSYSVQLRQFELGIRMAIGAQPYGIFSQVMKDNLTPLASGIGLGLLSLMGMWLWLQQTTYTFEPKIAQVLVPIGLIALLMTLTALVSVWSIIRKPASYALKGN